MSDFQPTDEQVEALRLFKTGGNLAIQAGAGTGKTRTLQLLAESCPDRVGIFTAFNKAIVTDAGTKMPSSTTCATMHSLAMRAVGRRYAHRLNSGRMKSNDIARRLRIDPIVVTYGTQRKPLAAGFLAGLTMRAVARFCQSGDAAPDLHHVPYVDGIDAPYPDGRRGYSNNDEVRRHILPAMRSAWEDLSKVDGTLPFRHEHYLKIFERSNPVLMADFVMVDECQPPGTMVDTIASRPPTYPSRTSRIVAGDVVRRPIESLAVGDRVVGYSQAGVRLNDRYGNTVTGVSVRPFDGHLVSVKTADGLTSRYTPNHICLARIGPAFEGKSVVYLMRRGEHFRVGVTSAHHGRTRNATAGIRGRLFEEGGDDGWVLGVFDMKAEALMEEEFISASFGVPQVCFKGDGHLGSNNSQATLDQFWERFGPNEDAGLAALAAYGRDIRYPLVTRDRRYLLYARPVEVRACNLLDGMMVLDATRFAAAGGKGRAAADAAGAWVPVSVGREPYSGPVYSLDVAVNHTYVADGIVTHNCQDLSGVMISIVEAQAENTQLVFVGDSAQSINEWMGAIDALGKVPADETTFLTRSFRFGPAVADVANRLLTRLGADLRLTGAASHASVVAAVAEPTCILTRTNAEAVRTVLSVQEQGRTPFLMGGGSDVIAFCRGAQDLLAGRWTSHQDLTCFGTWNEVQEYVDHDPQGSDLALLVKLIDDFGVDTIITALSNSVPEASADVTVSTAHKSKGCEWDSVQLAGDFFTPRDGADDVSPPELKLLYVACTRARRELDVTLVPHAVKAPAAKPIPLPAVDVPGEAPTSPVEARDACPLCGRTDVVRGGLVGAHSCVGVSR